MILSMREGVVRSFPRLHVSLCRYCAWRLVRTLCHSSSAPLPRNGWCVAPFSVPWCPYLLPFIFPELLREVILFFLCDVVIELRSRPRIAIVVLVSVKSRAFGFETA
jgi:hypothetical protein